ncbi:hypothetical protein JCM31826_06270 [Thermaurantimonas aggregans]|uniref:Uncharacterized protein n=1 Tax=Thermaurantimonas aggregans TaxID=2173829 RepID=A0A401XJD3_9FLAO|nr:hypothetical protein [Thermaurantimonas aggregans]MCX8148681.1 hypothetical protein [Thermaurantimonas aggregans]GCD77145.1 hypothetical protein JCM31826_06270 [Thermaurantimonas aggregans]
MTRRLLLYLLFSIYLLSCSFEKAPIPAYLYIPDVEMVTDYVTQGTASHGINSVWVTLENRELGVYELPARVLIPVEGEQSITLRYGISANGIRSMRDVYSMLQPVNETFNFQQGKSYYFEASNDSIPKALYRENAKVIIVEDFDGLGISLQRTEKSDTDIVKVTHPDSIFFNTQKPEINVASGRVPLKPGQTLVEIATSNRYVLPKNGQKVYLEMNFSGNQPFTVGIFANLFDRVVQAPVVQVRPTPGEWRKIYIDLTPEVSGNPNALDYQIFMGAVKPETNSPATEFLIDNLKLVYLQ